MSICTQVLNHFLCGSQSPIVYCLWVFLYTRQVFLRDFLKMAVAVAVDVKLPSLEFVLF